MTIALTNDEQAFIQAHLTDDVQQLMLRANPPGLDIKKIAAQLTARQKAKDKLPAWYANPDLIFPPALSVEQASSEQTAHYKASLVQGALLFDLTGGMGVDTWAFAERISQVVYVERNPELAELAAHNLPRLGANNVWVQTGDGLTFVENLAVLPVSEKADWLYLDPHRRTEQGGRVVRLADCEPDVSNPRTVAALLKKTSRILLKASPLLDIHATISQLAGAVDAVHVVAVQGEVKEVIFVLGPSITPFNAVGIWAVNLLPNRTDVLNFRLGDERSAEVRFGDPQTYIYEPNAAVLKSGAFRFVAAHFGLVKLAPNSHLYTSNTLRTDFPGRVFAVQAVSKPDAKTLKSLLPTLQANLTVRNFPQSVAELRKKLNLREGGTVYILATTLLNGDKRLLITDKV